MSELDPYCPTCDHGGHTCPGCGDDIDHGEFACATCTTEHQKSEVGHARRGGAVEAERRQDQAEPWNSALPTTLYVSAVSGDVKELLGEILKGRGLSLPRRVIEGLAAAGYQIVPTAAPGCPDGGACHHECDGGPCWRVANAGPLSGVYPDDQWPSQLDGSATAEPEDEAAAYIAQDLSTVKRQRVQLDRNATAAPGDDEVADAIAYLRITHKGTIREAKVETLVAEIERLRDQVEFEMTVSCANEQNLITEVNQLRAQLDGRAVSGDPLSEIRRIVQDWWEGSVPMNVALSEIKAHLGIHNGSGASE